MENKQPAKTPMGRGPKGKGPMGPMPKLDNPGKLIKRLLGFILKKYWLHYLIVIVCIIVFYVQQTCIFTSTLHR
mgnify:CR=1 FL=1